MQGLSYTTGGSRHSTCEHCNANHECVGERQEMMSWLPRKCFGLYLKRNINTKFSLLDLFYVHSLSLPYYRNNKVLYSCVSQMNCTTLPSHWHHLSYCLTKSRQFAYINVSREKVSLFGCCCFFPLYNNQLQNTQ